MREFLQPVVAVHPPPSGPDATRYVRSYLIMRVLVGAIGIGLPFALAVISFYFGKREGARPEAEGRRSPRFWRNFHWACAGAIAAALLWILLTEVGDVGPRESLLIGEAVSVWAFGISWLWKGLEVDLLRGG
jgi:hypothetical protein